MVGNLQESQTSRNMTISRLLNLYRANRGQQNEGTEANEDNGNRAELRDESSEAYPMRPLTNNYMENSAATLEEGIDLQQQSENLINRIEGSLERIQRIR